MAALAVAAALMAFASTADGPKPTPVSGVQVTADPKADVMVCRTEEVVGTRISKKVCGTQSARDEAERQSQKAIRDIISRGGPPPR